jgi:hypothetical protein
MAGLRPPDEVLAAAGPLWGAMPYDSGPDGDDSPSARSPPAEPFVATPLPAR